MISTKKKTVFASKFAIKLKIIISDTSKNWMEKNQILFHVIQTDIIA